MFDLSRSLSQLHPKHRMLECRWRDFCHLFLQITENYIVKQRSSARRKASWRTQQPVSVLCPLNQGRVKGSTSQIIDQDLLSLHDSLGRRITFGRRYRFFQQLHIRQTCSCRSFLHQLLLLIRIDSRHRKHRLFHRVALMVCFTQNKAEDLRIKFLCGIGLSSQQVRSIPQLSLELTHIPGGILFTKIIGCCTNQKFAILLQIHRGKNLFFTAQHRHNSPTHVDRLCFAVFQFGNLNVTGSHINPVASHDLTSIA